MRCIAHNLVQATLTHRSAPQLIKRLNNRSVLSCSKPFIANGEKKKKKTRIKHVFSSVTGSTRAQTHRAGTRFECELRARVWTWRTRAVGGDRGEGRRHRAHHVGPQRLPRRHRGLVLAGTVHGSTPSPNDTTPTPHHTTPHHTNTNTTRLSRINSIRPYHISPVSSPACIISRHLIAERVKAAPRVITP